MQQEELTAWIRLLMAPGIGCIGARQLLSEFGLPEQIWLQSETQIAQIVGRERAKALMVKPQGLTDLVAQTADWLEQSHAGARACMLTLADPRYPQRLLEMADPPVVLFGLVKPELLALDPPSWNKALCGRSVAIVGSRNPTPAGIVHARNFAGELARSGCTVVSGLALGIDGAAHTGALEAATQESPLCPSIAVVGTGLDRVYPRRHHQLAHELARKGLVLSEHPLGTPAMAAHFPRRNRLIAGLSRATLVVEAAVDSGSLITARLALEQGREVMAIPGSINSPQSRGCHALIRQGARLVESVQDIWDELGWQPVVAPASSACEAVTPCAHQALLEVMGHDPVGLDVMQSLTGLDVASLQVQLLELELAGQIGAFPGGRYQRLTAA
ncbi:MAG: hypothetical protein RLZZ271_295 [Pseudomonadota bacterium]